MTKFDKGMVINNIHTVEIDMFKRGKPVIRIYLIFFWAESG